jgi:hypothetical protein
MKINEIISEGHDGKKPKHTHGDKGEWKFRDVGGYDRVYHLNRIMVATAMADGKSTKPVDMDQSSWVEKFNVAHPYSEEEHTMMKQAFNTIDSEYEQSEKDHKSKEADDTHKVSPHHNPGPVKRKNEKSDKK